eukprot:TRINITY_DN13142_c0_g1_i1.p1 TRINITY_DN13142_c0_g1~~TRINITY_DN13142_c0_g1_i1.p1  ORF type:complete len:195 (+),score=51.43 TRINITY_DN13142_c0_g1_i1:132-716(+)
MDIFSYFIGILTGIIISVICFIFILIIIILIKKFASDDDTRFYSSPPYEMEELGLDSNNNIKPIDGIEDENTVLSSGVILSNEEDMEANDFQVQWEAIEYFREEEFSIISELELQNILANNRIFTIAQGHVEGEEKFYCYSQQKYGKLLFLCEIIVDISTKNCTLTIKCNDKKHLGSYLDHFYNSISPIITHDI